ncbi:MAG: TadE/TadG family type IV pilus assembly protein [Methylococcaceae bacterium]
MTVSKQKGASTVEFAMMLPLLLLLVVSVSEFGTLFYQLNALNKSVQIAARYLSDVSVNKAYTPAQKTDAQNLAVYGNRAGTGTPVMSGFVIANVVITNPDSEHVKVVATYPAYLILGNSLNAFMQMIGGSAATDFMTLTAGSVMRFAQ